jgi:hypothetical protein
MDIDYIFISTGIKFRNKKEVPVWYTGIYQPISNTGDIELYKTWLFNSDVVMPMKSLM